MTSLHALTSALRQLEAIYAEMNSANGQVQNVHIGRGHQFRHETLTESLACYLKGIRSISTLNACVLLLQAGYTQEVGALCRMLDDFCNEIMFLAFPGDGDKYSSDQIRFLENFYKEEFEEPNDPLKSPQKRDTVATKIIFATIGRLQKQEINPSDGQAIMRTVHQAFSGYVHAAYPHIMEMYSAPPGRFHVRGTLATSRIAEWERQLIGYVHRLIIVSVFVARKVDRTDLEPRLRTLLEEFEQATGSAPKAKPSELLRRLKKNSAT